MAKTRTQKVTNDKPDHTTYVKKPDYARNTDLARLLAMVPEEVMQNGPRANQNINTLDIASLEHKRQNAQYIIERLGITINAYSEMAREGDPHYCPIQQKACYEALKEEITYMEKLDMTIQNKYLNMRVNSQPRLAYNNDPNKQ